MLSKYKYQRLGSKNIRLLELQDPNDNARIIRRIISVPYDEAPSYMAISYVWGAEQEIAPRCLICEDTNSEISVTRNLEAALRSVVRSRTGRLPNTDKAMNDRTSLLVWTDAISINQTNNGEKGEQVSMMQQIFERAEDVHIWLGDEDENTGPAFALIGALLKISQLFPVSEVSASMKGFQDQLWEQFQSMGGIGNLARAYDALDALLGRAWFTRIWVVQEVAAARSAGAFCGGQSVDWDDLSKAVQVSLFAGFRLKAALNARRMMRIALTRREFGLKSAGNELDNEMKLLQRLLSRHHDSSSTIPHDMVYALRGLAGLSTINEERQRLARFPENQELGSRFDGHQVLDLVDYDQSMENLYRKVATQILSKCESLDLLGSCIWPHQGPETLPSWVPDWSRPRNRRPLGDPMDLPNDLPDSFSACGQYLKFKMQFRNEAWEICELMDFDEAKYLGISGFIVDLMETIPEESAQDSILSKFRLVKDHRLCLMPDAAQEGDAIGLFEGSRTPLLIRRSVDPEDAIHERDCQATIWKLLGNAWAPQLLDGRAFDIRKCTTFWLS